MNTKELLANYERGHQLLSEQISKIPPKAITHKPSDGSWSIAEVIVHLADAEAHAFVRGKKIIAESGGKVCVYNHLIWAEELFYSEMDYSDALEMIRIIRKNMVSVLSKVKDKVWKNYIYHPESGKITLLEWIQLNIDHINIHIKQIGRIFYDWEKARKEEYA